MLYIIATPIGNLKEITARAVETLSLVDAVFCEDTRRTKILLDSLDISKPLISYHKFSEKEKAGMIIDRLKNGENLALVSDAGMPVISDPGGILIGVLKEEKLAYTVISGPCALINALVLSGLDASAFSFLGFLPEKNKDKKALLDRFLGTGATMILYSARHNILKDLQFLYNHLGNRKVCVVREISKMYEECITFDLQTVPEFDLRGEFVIVIEGIKTENPLISLTEKEHILYYIEKGLSKNDAVKQAAKDRGVSKSEIYKFSLDI